MGRAGWGQPRSAKSTDPLPHTVSLTPATRSAGAVRPGWLGGRGLVTAVHLFTRALQPPSQLSALFSKKLPTFGLFHQEQDEWVREGVADPLRPPHLTGPPTPTCSDRGCPSEPAAPSRVRACAPWTPRPALVSECPRGRPGAPCPDRGGGAAESPQGPESCPGRCLRPLRIHGWKPTPGWDDVRRWDLREVRRVP